MEHSFEIAAPDFRSGTRLEANEYPGGHLDWQAFDLAAKQPPSFSNASSSIRVTTIPVPVEFPGMPAGRWWTFEDGAVYWGGIEGGPEDLARYLVASFATASGNDWFLVPVDLPYGALAQVTSVRVRDSFDGVHPVVATAVLDHKRLQARRRFRVFELTGDAAPAAGLAPRLFVPPSLPAHEQSDPLEEVLLLRDEVANLAWAAERLVESPAGRAASRAARTGVEPVSQQPAPGAWTYDLSSPVPAYFVPLVPVRIRESAGIRLQRGRMATEAGPSGARGILLEPARRLLLHEEGVPASGVRVTRAYQMCRGADALVYMWSGRRKTPGARLPAPGLVHDVLHIGAQNS
jgi:hypothetical protein